ncbi:MAG: DNA-3-methyladenine glycosylase I [Pseudomonadota bacterium]
MQSFEQILEYANSRHGEEVMLGQIQSAQPLSAAKLSAIPDDRWLATATKCIFQAGFNWKVIENKWEGFEQAFEGFDLGRWILSNDDDIAMLASDKRIVRNPQKINTVPENARFFGEVSKQHGGFGKWIAQSPARERNLLLEELNKRGSRMGAMTGQYFLRFMNADSYILSRDVTAALVRAGVIDKQPTSKKAMVAVQEAFNAWMDESGYGLTQLSRILARSIDG